MAIGPSKGFMGKILGRTTGKLVDSGDASGDMMTNFRKSKKKIGINPVKGAGKIFGGMAKKMLGR